MGTPSDDQTWQLKNYENHPTKTTQITYIYIYKWWAFHSHTWLPKGHVVTLTFGDKIVRLSGYSIGYIGLAWSTTAWHHSKWTFIYLAFFWGPFGNETWLAGNSQLNGQHFNGNLSEQNGVSWSQSIIWIICNYMQLLTNLSSGVFHLHIFTLHIDSTIFPCHTGGPGWSPPGPWPPLCRQCPWQCRCPPASRQAHRSHHHPSWRRSRPRTSGSLPRKAARISQA